MKFGNLILCILFVSLAVAGLQCSEPAVPCKFSSECDAFLVCLDGVCKPSSAVERSSDSGNAESSSEKEQHDVANQEQTAEVVLGPDAGVEQQPETAIGKEAGPETVKEDGPEEITGEGVAPPQLRIWIAGDKKPVSFTDGLAGKTPNDFTMGIQKFEILRSRTDPNPVTVFDFKDKFTQSSMDVRTLVGAGFFSTIPKGTYTFGRTTVVNMSFNVPASAHAAGFAIPGLLKIYYAIGNHKDAKGKTYKIGDVAGSFDGAGQSFPYQTNIPVKFSLSDPETWVETSSGKTEFYFKIGKPIDSSVVTQDVDVTLNFSIYEAFRWRDLDKPKYTKNVFDMTTSPSTSEQVLRYGANNYRITQP